MTNEGIVVVISSGPPITELDVRFTTRPFIHIYLSISEKYVVVCSIFSIWLIFFFSSAAKSASPFVRKTGISTSNRKREYPHHIENRNIHIRKTGISTSEKQGYPHQIEKQGYPHQIENRDIHII